MSLARLDRAASIATLVLDRPEARNPTSIAMLEAMDAALDEVEGDEGVRALIVTGEGRAFCSGLDLDEVRGPEKTVREMLEKLSLVMRRIRRLPVPTIARVQGAAIGGGFGFMAVCDFRVTHPEAKIGYPPLETCLSPALMAPWLVRIVGPARARVLLLQGGTIDGRSAHDLGIATHLVERDALQETAAALAERVTSGGRYAAAAMKSLLLELDGSLDDEHLDRAARVSADVIVHPESREMQSRTIG